MFFADDATDSIVLIGEIGGREEEAAAEFLCQGCAKPVFALVAGRHAPAARRMGHAGTLTATGGDGAAKIAALEAAGVQVIRDVSAVGETVRADTAGGTA